MAQARGGGAVPRLHGPVEDGDLAGVFVCNGNDEAWAVHEHCWEVLGRPTSHARELAPEASAAWRMVARYHEQLFAFRQLDDDGHGWMLVDPSGESADARRNAERILAMR